MDTRKLSIGLISLALLAGAWTFAQPAGQPPAKEGEKHEEKAGAESDEEVIDFAKAPEPVRTAALKVIGAAGEKAIKKVIEEEDEEVYTYEIEYNEGGMDCSAVFSAAGDTLEIEKSMKEGSLPAAAMAALKKDYPKATFKNPIAVQKFFYEIGIEVDGKMHEVKVDAAGNIEDESSEGAKEGDKDADEGNEKGKKADAADDGFRNTFTVDKTKLASTGVNPFFDLTPGTLHTYRDGKVTLAIRVLDETRVVDGVKTRIIEEREEVDGKPKEISRNFFAIDPANNDVSYFGEEVDEFDGAGKVSHPGVWLSGVKGAHFGLMIPGNPKVGDRFYQEIAPGVAMDRFEIVGMDDTIETPAGKFEHCIHARETTPIEKDTGHKWYVRGVGLVKDGDQVLVSRTPAKK